METVSSAIVTVLRRHVPPEKHPTLEDPDAVLSDAGLDSLKIVEFVLDLERSLSVRFPPEAMNRDNFRSISAIVSLVSRAPA